MAQAISSLIFSTRRTNSGFDAADNNAPAVALMNWDIACGQIFKAAKETIDASKGVKTELATKILSAEEYIKNLSYGDRVLQGAGKVASFTANNINPLICLTGALKVAYADDTQSAAIQEATALATMFSFESLAKTLLGLPLVKTVDGVKKKFQRESLIMNTLKKSDFINNNLKTIKNYILKSEAGKKVLKYAPTFVKGIGFVTASIVGYQLGNKTGEKIAAAVKNKQTISKERNKKSNDSVNEYNLLSLTKKNA